ncbi:MAG: D-arabinono-1,4-lactone oxidase [Pseudomonadota bacterium]
MPNWHNWSGRITAEPERLVFIRSPEDACALASAAQRDGKSIRVGGATHSHAPLVAHDGIIAYADGLAGVLAVDAASERAWIGAGTRIYALGHALHQHGLALHNQGDIDQQALAGATGTGTHGTGAALNSLSARVTGMRIALASGELVTASETQHRELWQAARLHLGAFGIVTAIELQLRRAYRLREQGWQMSLDAALDGFFERAAQHRHYEFFWYPQADNAIVKAIDETEDAPEYPLADEGARCGWNYEVLPNHRPHKHTEMEYSVPADTALDCVREIRDLLRNQFADVAWPVEFRTLAADDVWLSSAYERPTVTISVHQDVRQDETAYYRACEAIFLRHGGRPHWGKVHYLNREQLSERHPRWSDWWQARNSVDPDGVFLNDHLAALRPDA